MIQWFSELNCTKASLVSGTIVLPAHCLLLPFQCYNPPFLTAFCKLWTTPHFSSFLAMVHLFYSETLRAVQNLKRHSALLTATLQVFWIIVKKQTICGLIEYHPLLIPLNYNIPAQSLKWAMCVLQLNKSPLSESESESGQFHCINFSEWSIPFNRVKICVRFAKDKFPKTR